MKILGETNLQDICCNSMITALQKEVFWVEDRKVEGLVFGFENIKWDQDAGEYLPQDFVLVDHCLFCGTKVEINFL